MRDEGDCIQANTSFLLLAHSLSSKVGNWKGGGFHLMDMRNTVGETDLGHFERWSLKNLNI